MKKIKKIICILFVLILCVQNTISAFAMENKVDLRKLSGQECLEILLDNGLVIPETYSKYSDVPGFVKKIVYSVYDSPSRTNEGLFSSGVETYNTIYDSDIIYIKYKI